VVPNDVSSDSILCVARERAPRDEQVSCEGSYTQNDVMLALALHHDSIRYVVARSVFLFGFIFHETLASPSLLPLNTLPSSQNTHERAKRVSFSLYNQYVNRYQIKWYYCISTPLLAG
jgi:hypothetical protein